MPRSHSGRPAPPSRRARRPQRGHCSVRIGACWRRFRTGARLPTTFTAHPHLRAPSNPPRLVPAPVSASPVSIAALASHMAAGGTFKVEAPASDWALVLALALRDLLPGREAEGDLDRIQKVIDGRDAWKGLPAPIAVRLLELIAARLRSLQVAGVSDRRVDIAFSCVSAWLKKEKPGFAYGLMRDHRPRSGSWDEDVDAAVDDLYDALPAAEATPKVGKRLVALEGLVAELSSCPAEVSDAVRAQIRSEVSALLTDGVSARNTRLVHIVAPVADDLTGPEMRALRRAARAMVADAAAVPDGDEEADGPMPEDWPWWSVTRGKRAVMVGGDPREPNRVRLEKAFEFADLVVVPEPWVRRVPRTALTRRAEIALRVAVAHLAATVEHRARAEMQVPLPF